MRRFFIILALFSLTCGDDGKPVTCSGTTCSCPPGASCTIGGSACSAGSCSLTCTDHTMCSGACGQSCSLNCAGGSTCSLTLGPSGSASCTGDSTCHIACTGSCSLSCTAATCDLRCAGDSSPHAVSQGGHCQTVASTSHDRLVCVRHPSTPSHSWADLVLSSLRSRGSRRAWAQSNSWAVSAPSLGTQACG
jgi:hypothetical protein